ncbi:hypothetical protein J6590_005587 [Homalodisca vitripennis]|nr:hypothetical protein J6590_005587 [Homalodisca vitripennis]
MTPCGPSYVKRKQLSQSCRPVHLPGLLDWCNGRRNSRHFHYIASIHVILCKTMCSGCGASDSRPFHYIASIHVILCKTMCSGCGASDSRPFHYIASIHVILCKPMYCGCSASDSRPFHYIASIHVILCKTMCCGCGASDSRPFHYIASIHVILCKTMYSGCSASDSRPFHYIASIHVILCKTMCSGCGASDSRPFHYIASIHVILCKIMYSGCSASDSRPFHYIASIHVILCKPMYCGCSASDSRPFHYIASIHVILCKTMCSGCGASDSRPFHYIASIHKKISLPLPRTTERAGLCKEGGMQGVVRLLQSDGSATSDTRLRSLTLELSRLSALSRADPVRRTHWTGIVTLPGVTLFHDFEDSQRDQIERVQSRSNWVLAEPSRERSGLRWPMSTEHKAARSHGLSGTAAYRVPTGFPKTFGIPCVCLSVVTAWATHRAQDNASPTRAEKAYRVPTGFPKTFGIPCVCLSVVTAWATHRAQDNASPTRAEKGLGCVGQCPPNTRPRGHMVLQRAACQPAFQKTFGIPCSIPISDDELSSLKFPKMVMTEVVLCPFQSHYTRVPDSLSDKGITKQYSQISNTPLAQIPRAEGDSLRCTRCPAESRQGPLKEMGEPSVFHLRFHLPSNLSRLTTPDLPPSDKSNDDTPSVCAPRSINRPRA